MIREGELQGELRLIQGWDVGAEARVCSSSSNSGGGEIRVNRRCRIGIQEAVE
jgi:hypothetical protein